MDKKVSPTELLAIGFSLYSNDKLNLKYYEDTVFKYSVSADYSIWYSQNKNQFMLKFDADTDGIILNIESMNDLLITLDLLDNE